MTPARARPLRHVLATHRDEWDRDDTRPAVREAFAKVVDCGTEALGAEVFASEGGEERVVYHTCKSRACPSCGHQATRAWQRDQWRELPDVPYAHVCLTMPDVLWPMFQRNRHLLHDLPVLGAQVLQQWARQKYGIRLIIVVIPHTFGRHLNFNCHLHILVSEGGLREDGTQWRARARLDRKALMPMWRYAVITLLRDAERAGVLDTDMSRSALLRSLTAQYERWRNIDIKRFRSKKQFLGYAGRYARRPPIAQHRFRTINRQEIRFVTKDTRTKRNVETTYTPAAFLATLADHVPDRYRHNVRYFGLLAPRVKCQTHDAVFALLGQERLGKPRRLRWATSMQKCFGVDHYARPALLAIDEIGYLAYDAHAADLLFQIVSRRYEHRPLLMTTNLAFKHWDTIFPNASCAVALIDRLTHHAEIVVIEGDSYRKREAELSQKQ